MWLNILLVATGGAIGTIFRFLIISCFKSTNSINFGTFLANILGSFLIGFFGTYIKNKYYYPSSFSSSSSSSSYNNELYLTWTLFIQTGFLGGLTTFSSLIFELDKLYTNQNYLWFIFYPILSIILGLAFYYLGKSLN